METKDPKITELNIGEKMMEASISRAIKKLIKMKQIANRCPFKEATDLTVDFLIKTVKEVKDE